MFLAVFFAVEPEAAFHQRLVMTAAALLLSSRLSPKLARATAVGIAVLGLGSRFWS